MTITNLSKCLEIRKPSNKKSNYLEWQHITRTSSCFSFSANSFPNKATLFESDKSSEWMETFYQIKVEVIKIEYYLKTVGENKLCNIPDFLNL